MGIEAAIIGSAIISGGAALIGGGQAASAAREAAAVQAVGATQSIAEQRRQFDISQGQIAPFLATSVAANDALARLLNLQPAAPPTAPGAGAGVRPDVFGTPVPAGGIDVTGLPPSGVPRFDFGREDISGVPGTVGFQPRVAAPVAAPPTTTAAPAGEPLPTGLDVFEASPGFEFRQRRGEEAINRAAAARGRFFSGAAVEQLTEFSSGIASDEFNSFFNRLNAIRTGTSGAAGQAVAAGAESTRGIVEGITGAAASRASGIAAAANARNQALAGVAQAGTGAISNFLLRNPPPTTPPAFTTPPLQLQPQIPFSLVPGG